MRTLIRPNHAAQRHFVLLAPPDAVVPEWFHHIDVDRDKHNRLLAAMQRTRGRAYLEDGAIQGSELTSDGRHDMPLDHRSWHILMLEDGEVAGCMRYVAYGASVNFAALGVAHSSLAQSDVWGPKLRKAVDSVIAQARHEDVGIGEAGGWALAESIRCSTAALTIVLATYSLAQVLGEALVFSTATTRNGSAPILRRIGGESLYADNLEVPSYFDPQYQCEMQVLRFDSRAPSARYQDGVEQVRNHLLTVPVLCTSVRTASAAGTKHYSVRLPQPAIAA